MRFWDSSGIVPLLAAERSTAAMSELLVDDPGIAVWWATPVECASAIARRSRSDARDPDAPVRSFARLADLRRAWVEIEPEDRVREVAVRLVRVHDLRAADSLQLAAAILASEERPETLELVTLDERLALAAGHEGFRVLGLER